MNAPATLRRAWTSRLTWAACAVAAATALAQPTTTPSTHPDAAAATSAPATQPRWGRRPPPPGSRLLRFRDISGLAAPELPDGQTVTQPDDDEWQRISDFAQENFSNRWKRFTEIQASRPDSPVLQRLKDRIVVRYRTLKRVETDLPDVYAAALHQGKLEDEAWGASLAARRNPKDAKLQAAMREKVAALVKDVLAERQKRLDALQQTLKTQQDDLDRDKQDVEGLIDLQMNRLTGDDPSDYWRRRREGPP